jgi:dCMP deaminase
MMQAEWLNWFMEQARNVARLSKDSTQVGAVIVDNRRNIVATGYNGFPRGCDDRYDIAKERKLRRTIHAELNAILTARRDLQDFSLFTTKHPCANCMGAIIQSGITTVYIPSYAIISPSWLDEWLEAEQMAIEVGIEICRI